MPTRRPKGLDTIEVIDLSSDIEHDNAPRAMHKTAPPFWDHIEASGTIEVNNKEDLAPIAGPSRQNRSVIDLTILDEEEEDRPTLQPSNMKPDLDVIEISTDEDEPIVVPPSKSNGKKRPGPRLSFKDVLDELYEGEKAKLNTQDASDISKVACKDGSQKSLQDLTNLPDVTKDEEIARELANEQALTVPLVKVNTKQQRADEALARRLAKEEQKEYLKFVKTVDQKAEGIVFRVAIDATTNTLEDGTDAHPDDLDRFEPWHRKFEESMSGFKVKKFHWFVNYELEKRFETAREKLRILCGKEPEELMMFHGTAPQNVDLILKNGFKIGGQKGHQVKNGTALGYGIYLAESAAMSLGYVLDGNRMFACRVLPGRTTQNRQYSSTIPKVAVGSGPFESFVTPAVYVVRHTDLVLPCYLIEWYRPTVPPYMQIPRPLMPAMPSGGQLTRPSLLAPPAQWQLWLAQNQRLNPVILPQPAPPRVTPYVPPPSLAAAPVAPVGPTLGTSRRRQKASTEVLHRNYAHSMTAKVKVKRKP